MHNLKRALCLDFDGTIRKSKTQTFIKDENDIELIVGMENLMWKYRNMGWLIIGISNQGGVAHGHKTVDQINKELDATLKLYKVHPFHIIKMCYHMEGGNTEPYNHRSLLRKPDIGMLALAEVDAFNAGHVIDWDKSIFVGDREEDKLCAEKANIKFYDITEFLSMPHTFKI